MVKINLLLINKYVLIMLIYLFLYKMIIIFKKIESSLTVLLIKKHKKQ